MSFFRNYDPGKQYLTFAGINIYGFASGTFIEIERDEDAFTKEVGAHGDTTRVRSHNKGGKVTFTLKASSPCNDLLSARAIGDEQSGLGSGPVLMKDLNGTTVVESPDAWIKKLPKIERGTEASNVVWELDCHDLTPYIGGALT